MMIRTPRITLIAAVLGVAVAAVTFLGAARSDEKDSAKKEPAKAATNGNPGRGLVCLGSVDAETRAYGLFPRIFPMPSEVTEMFVKEGQHVKQNQDLLKMNVVADKALADLTVEEAQAAVEETTSLLAQAKQAVEAHETLIQIQKSVVEAKQRALEKSRIDVEALKKAARTGLRKQDEVDAALKGIEAMEKEVEAETHKYLGLEKVRPSTKVDQARAGLERAKVALKKAQHALQPQIMKAPTEGTILRSFVSVGTTFGPQTREPAFYFQPKSTLIVRAEVEQEFANRVKVGQVAAIEDYMNSGLEWSGQVTRISDAFLPKRSNNTGSVELVASTGETVLEAIVAIDPKPNSQPLRVGQRVRIKLRTD